MNAGQEVEPPARHAQANAAPARRSRTLADWLFAPWMREESAGYQDWQGDVHRAVVEQQPLRARAILYAVAVTVVLLLVWAALAEIDEVTRGSGKVIPSRQVQVIQSQDGGVVTEIPVREGDRVEQGQLLVRLDETRSRATLRENRAEYQALAVRAERLRALLRQSAFEPAPELMAAVPAIVAEETALLHSQREELANEQQIAREQLTQRRQELAEVSAREAQAARSLELSSEELRVTRPMVDSGAVSEVEILRLERQVNELSGERAQAAAQIKRIESAIGEAEAKLREVEVQFMNGLREQLAETLSRMNGLREVSQGLSDRVRQTELRAPVSGTVNQLHFHTIGAVVLPGDKIVEVVPADDTLLLEARIRPQDIAFLVPGQPALVKFSAYDFVVYGGLEGVVEHIGADTIVDEEGNPYYEVLVRTLESDIAADKPIIPGMTVEVDILTGKKSVLAYLMKPVLRARQYALTER